MSKLNKKRVKRLWEEGREEDGEGEEKVSVFTGTGQGYIALDR